MGTSASRRLNSDILLTFLWVSRCAVRPGPCCIPCPMSILFSRCVLEVISLSQLLMSTLNNDMWLAMDVEAALAWPTDCAENDDTGDSAELGEDARHVDSKVAVQLSLIFARSSPEAVMSSENRFNFEASRLFEKGKSCAHC